MALEYLYDCVRAKAGEKISIDAKITNYGGDPVTEGCSLALYDMHGSTIANVDGRYDGTEKLWQFTIPAASTAKLRGRYFYCVFNNAISMNFQTPIYFE